MLKAAPETGAWKWPLFRVLATPHQEANDVSDAGEIQQQLEHLRERFKETTLPVCAQLAEALLTRAENEREAVATKLLQRAEQCLAAAHQTQSLDDKVTAAATNTSSLLAELVDSLRQDAVQAAAPVLSKLDQQLQDQNTRLLGEALPTPVPDDAPQPEADGLRAAQKFRHTQQRHAKRKTVEFALERRPENPGPLNPQMLAVKILSEIQAVSPAYLERYVSFMDALVTLEKSTNKATRSAKKATRQKGA
ncbi:DUF2894 domain-containing protein [Litorivivens sp.]|uniref:DUF2894 domain-containing protein n=1 Tax=Litorivivens sp. TaxID=2020868 RepID=UPI00356B1AA9